MRFCVLVLLSACVAPTPKQTGKVELPPANLAYSQPAFSLVVGEAFGPETPYYDGGDATAFSISPSLPAGLTFTAENGVIVGSPQEASATATYTVTASNDYGEATTTFTLTVQAAATAPTALSYAFANATYVTGMAIPTNAPTLSGTSPFTFSISPALPAGLTLNMTTGAITGTPTATQPATSYTITATNSKGSTTATIQITISATLVAPVITGYTQATATYAKDVAITANQPVLSGGPPASFAISGATLPAGLAFNTTNGHFTGAPTELVSPARLFNVTATNAAGTSAAFVVSISVNAPALPTLTYAAGPFTFRTPGTKIPNITPTLSGNTQPLTISPTPPAWLSFSTATGTFSGKPEGAASDVTYTVTATSGAGSVTQMVRIVTQALAAATSAGQIAVLTDAVMLSNPTFNPATTTIDCGATVEWTAAVIYTSWQESITPSNPSDAWSQHLFPVSASPQTFSLGFNAPGTYTYFSSHSSAGNATITVNNNCP